VDIQYDLIIDSAPFLLKGAVATIELSLGGMAFGLILGLISGLMRLSHWWSLRTIAGVYVSFIRGTPLLVQLFILYYGLAEFGFRLSPLLAAVIGFSLNVGGYTAEVFRSAIAAIDKGQWEAGAVIGMTKPQTMMRIILPQAARIALPPLGNTFIGLIKDTSMAATIQVPELFRQAQLITARTYQVFTLYIAAAVIYWVISAVLSWGQHRLERRANAHVQ
jgi:cystine transport system permease protein